MEKGLTHTSTTEVKQENTARTIGSGNLEVFATPAMAALMENAAMLAVAESLPEGSATVGSLLQITHNRPSGLGETVQATATLEEVDGRKLTFSVTASDSMGVIGEGRHVRYVVDTLKFMEKVL